MNKKLLIILVIICIFVFGCSKKNSTTKKTNTTPIEEKDKDNNNDKKEDIDTNTYTDNNNTPIGIYSDNGTRMTSMNTSLTPLENIGSFLVYPSNENTVNFNGRFGDSFHDEWIKYNTNNLLKIGFNIKFSLDDGRNVSFNVLDPNSAIGEYNEYMLCYLYDAYKNRNSSFYSHIEQNELTSDTLYTSIKLQTGGYGNRINSKILLTVFTYDSEDDFLDNEYRGNSKHTVTICVNGYEC